MGVLLIACCTHHLLSTQDWTAASRDSRSVSHPRQCLTAPGPEKSSQAGPSAPSGGHEVGVTASGLLPGALPRGPFPTPNAHLPTPQTTEQTQSPNQGLHSDALCSKMIMRIPPLRKSKHPRPVTQAGPTASHWCKVQTHPRWAQACPSPSGDRIPWTGE